MADRELNMLIAQVIVRHVEIAIRSPDDAIRLSDAIQRAYDLAYAGTNNLQAASEALSDFSDTESTLLQDVVEFLLKHVPKSKWERLLDEDEDEDES
jgi:hypothetical protein